MKNKVIKTLLILTVAFSTLNAEYSKPVKVPSITYPLEFDKNFRVIQRNCQWCHSFGYITNQGKQSKPFWRASVVKMRDVYKAPITKADEEAIVEYLFKHYGNGKLK